MTTERFDIVVQDQVAKSIRAELAAIGSTATATDGTIRKLNASLSGLSAAQDKNSIAAERLAQQQAKTELAQARLVEQVAKGELAQVRAAAAADKAVQADRRREEQARATTRALQEEAAANAAVGRDGLPVGPGVRPVNIADPVVPQAAARAAGGETLNLTSDMAAAAALTGSVKTAEKELEGLASRSPSLLARFRSAAVGAFDTARDAAMHWGSSIKGLSFGASIAKDAEEGAVGVAKAATHIRGSSTVVRESLVLMREAARGDFTRMAGSATILAQALEILPVAIAVGVVSFGALFAAHRAFNDDVAKSELKSYAATLGLTDKEMRKLSNTTLDHKGHLEELNLVQITYMDTLKGLWDTIAHTEAAKSAWETIKTTTSNALSAIGGFLRTAAVDTIGVEKGTMNAIVVIWKELPATIGDLFVQATNFAIEEMNKMINAAIRGVNSFAKEANALLGTDLFGQLSEVEIPKIENRFAGAAARMGTDVRGAYSSAFAEADKLLGGFAAKWRANSIQEAKDRLKAEADAITGNRNPHKGRTPVDTEGNAIAKTLRDLQGQLDNLADVGLAGRIKQHMTEITNSLASHKVDLASAAYATLREKILGLVTAIETEKPIAQEMQRIYEQTTGVQEKYNASIVAINRSLANHTINQQEATRRTNLAQTALANGLDPLKKYNDALKQRNQFMLLYGRELAVQTRAQELYNDAVDHGKKTGEDRGDFVQQARKELKTEDQTTAFGTIDRREHSARNDPTNSQYILAHYKEMYAAIDAMRTGDTESEATAAQKKKDLDAAYLDARLENTSTMLNNLATLSTSKNKELAAIGKAAAIVEATIDGVRAVQKALAAYPPPVNFVMAAAVGVASAVNVAKIAGLGFMTGGYTGNGSPSERAGDVHKGEYVFDAGATNRIGVPQLEALRRGAIVPGNDNAQRPGVTVHQYPGVAVEVRERSDGEIEVIAERAAKRVAPQAVAQDLRGNANGPMSTALKQTHGLQRQR